MHVSSLLFKGPVEDAMNGAAILQSFVGANDIDILEAAVTTTRFEETLPVTWDDHFHKSKTPQNSTSMQRPLLRSESVVLSSSLATSPGRLNRRVRAVLDNHRKQKTGFLSYKMKS